MTPQERINKLYSDVESHLRKIIVEVQTIDAVTKHELLEIRGEIITDEAVAAAYEIKDRVASLTVENSELKRTLQEVSSESTKWQTQCWEARNEFTRAHATAEMLKHFLRMYRNVLPHELSVELEKRLLLD